MIIDLTLAPTTITTGWQTNTAASSNPFIASSQTVDRGGHRIALSYVYRALHGETRAAMRALIARLRGQSHRLRAPIYDNTKLGRYGGRPLVSGGGQQGYSLNIRGAAASTTRWIAAGDYFSVIVNGEPELKIATRDVDTDAAGTAVLHFEPRLRGSPIHGAAIHVEDGRLPKPSGIFLLAAADTAMSSQRGRFSAVSSVTLSLIEDVYATQALTPSVTRRAQGRLVGRITLAMTGSATPKSPPAGEIPTGLQ